MKRAITTLCFGQALKRSCVHKMQVTFNNRLTALSKATFLNSVQKSVAEPLLQNLEESIPTSTQEPVSGVVRGQMCDLSAQDEPQFEKKVANMCGVPVVFATPNRLAELRGQLLDRLPSQGVFT